MLKIEMLPFILSIALNATLSTFLFREFFWRRLKVMSIADAARPILWLHAFRFFGLTFIAPGLRIRLSHTIGRGMQRSAT